MADWLEMAKMKSKIKRLKLGRTVLPHVLIENLLNVI